MLDIWAMKQAGVTSDDVESRNAMARGHMLEPYAIQAFNEAEIEPDYALEHWDNALIFRGIVAYSPDALSVPAPDRTVYDGALVQPVLMGEVKAYEPKKHYSTAIADKMTLEERWQIATAFYVSDYLEHGYLILFNPNCQHKLFVHKYSRADLRDELEAVHEVAVNYNAYAANAPRTFSELDHGASLTEQEIIAELIAQEAVANGALNP